MLGAFKHPKKVDYTVDELIEDYVAGNDYEESDDGNVSHRKLLRNAARSCFFVGIVRTLHDHKKYHDDSGIEKCVGEDCDGHEEFDDPEPEEIHGWSGSWEEESKKPKLNSLYYGVKLGSIMEYSKEYAKKVADQPSRGTSLSSPMARFHQDMSKVVSRKGGNESATPADIAVCRARHNQIDDDTFYGDDGAYSSKTWSHDGNVGFMHTGAGWKNREFHGHLYAFDIGNDEESRGFVSHSFSNEFWSTPSSLFADSPNNTVWVHGDNRIKGFSIQQQDSRGQHSFCTNYVFNVLSDKAALATLSDTIQADSNKRRKLTGNDNEDRGFRQNIIVFGSDRLAYLHNGILQEWKLDLANRHNGRRRVSIWTIGKKMLPCTTRTKF